MPSPHVGAYVHVPDRCPVACKATGDSDVEVQFGGYTNGFDLILGRTVLARLIELGERVLATE